MRDLIEHFSQYTLSLANVPEDELGQAYEFLIKKFADHSGHTATLMALRRLPRSMRFAPTMPT
jgi:hypothetical protein